MADLRFTVEREQLRGIGILTALVLVLVLISGLKSASTGHIGLAGTVAFGAGGLVCLYPFTAYMLAVTECTPTEIRTRGLGGPRRCSWPEVTDIGLRYTSRSLVVSVTTRSGRQFWLGAPMHGDPEFDKKLSQIQAYWRVITAGQEPTTDTSHGSDSLVLTVADLPVVFVCLRWCCFDTAEPVVGTG